MVQRAAIVSDGATRFRLEPGPGRFLRLPAAEGHQMEVGQIAAAVYHSDRPSAPLSLDTSDPEIQGHEAGEVLARWRQGVAHLEPATRRVLELAVEHGRVDAQILASEPLLRGETATVIEELCGVRQIPLETPTLPPAKHTNAYVVGDERSIIVDPATYDPIEREKLKRAIQESGTQPLAVVLTHHHPDHFGSAEWLRAEIGVPVWAHPITRDLLDGVVTIDRTLEEGDRIELGRDREGRDFALDLLFTPGHAPGHLVLVDTRASVPNLIVGDMVAAVGTIIVDPPEGDMAAYIRELTRLRDMSPGVLFPAHGPMISDGVAKLQGYIDHRGAREAKVLAALEALGPAKPETLLPMAYDDTPEFLYGLAARSCLAHLLKLVHDGEATEEAGRGIFRRLSSS